MSLKRWISSETATHLGYRSILRIWICTFVLLILIKTLVHACYFNISSRNIIVLFYYVYLILNNQFSLDSCENTPIYMCNIKLCRYFISRIFFHCNFYLESLTTKLFCILNSLALRSGSHKILSRIVNCDKFPACLSGVMMSCLPSSRPTQTPRHLSGVIMSLPSSRLTHTPRRFLYNVNKKHLCTLLDVISSYGEYVFWQI